MTLYRWDGKLLFRNGALAIHERCCCDDCDCPDCDICPYCCLTWSKWLVSWNECECPYLTFVYNDPGTPEEEDCWEDNPPNTSCTESGGMKGPYWVSNCKWEIPGYWNCLKDGSGGVPEFAGCGVLVVELKNSTTIELSIKSGEGPTGCVDEGDVAADCDDAINDVITIDITAIDIGDETSICNTSGTPKRSEGGGLSSVPNGCVSEVQFDYTQDPCCPDTHPDECDEASEGEGGGEGCCEEDPSIETEEECTESEFNWTSEPCDEGSPP